MSTPPCPGPVPAPACLGVYLSNREVGLAVIRGHQVVHDGVLNLRKLASDVARERRFRQFVKVLVDEHDVRAIAVVEPDREEPSVVVRNQRTWLASLARLHWMPLKLFGSTDVCTHLRPERPSLRGMTESLVRRFPELASKAHQGRRSSAPPNGPREIASRVAARIRTERERYWSHMFVALGGAVLWNERCQLTHDHAAL